MKVVYLLQNPGIERSTPEGWSAAVGQAEPDGTYSASLLAELDDADAIVVGFEPVTEDLLSRASRLKLVQRLGVGFENVDVAAAMRNDVFVCNMPDFNSATVAEHAIALMLAVLRGAFEATLLMKAGQWPVGAVAARTFDLQGKTVGLLGYGAIGQAVATRLRAFGVRLLCHDIRPLATLDDDVLQVSFERLLADSDILSLHVPLTPETHHLIDAHALEAMKDTSVLVNTARGAVVDEGALADALDRGTIAGAGIDAFAVEPLPAEHRLRRCRNIVLTPHTAGQSREAMSRMVDAMTENLRRIERGEPPLHRVPPPAAPPATAP